MTFSGVVRLPDGELRAEGLADRAHHIPMRVDTQLAMASGSKVFTALAALRLIEDGVLTLDAPIRPVLGADLPLVDDAVTVEHLLGHTSGIGDYLDEESGAPIDAHVLRQPVHVYDRTEAFLPDLDHHPQREAPGTTWRYNNGGYVVLALVIERASGTPFHDLVQHHVLDRAGLADTGYLRSDALPGRAATGYLDDDPASLRTNVHHLPVRGNGDGGAYTTVADVDRFWRALLDGRIVGPVTLARMTSGDRYGLGLALPGDGALQIEGYDAGVSFMSRHHPGTGVTWTVLANSSEGAWPLARALIGQG